LQVIATTYTDSIGNFEFRNVQPGTYFISVNADGYDEVRQAVEVYNSANGLSNVSIFLARKDGSRDKSPLDSADPDIIDVSQMKENFPRKAVQNYEKAVEEIKKGQNDRAVKLLEESIQIAPNFFRAHNDLGLLYQRAKRYRDAEKEYRRCHELVPRSAQPLINLGSLFVQEAEFRTDEPPQTLGKILDQALDALEEAVKLNPRSAIAYYYLGAANFKSSFLEEAEAALKRAREIDPNVGMVRLMLANVYMKQNKWNDVLENLDAYIQENPKANDRASVEEMRAKIAKGLEASK
jgi:superkiller protein 3